MGGRLAVTGVEAAHSWFVMLTFRRFVEGAEMMTVKKRAVAIAVTLTIAACGGGTDDGGGLGEDVFGGIGEASSDVETEDQGSGGGTEIGPVTQTADPSTGWVEVDGERFEFEAFGSTHYSCELLEDRITINFQQTTTGSDFTLQGGKVNGQWNASLTFAPSEANSVTYGASVGFDPGTLGIDDQAISYEGNMKRVEDFDIVNAQDVQGTVAVNCTAPGGDPTAEVDGNSYTFPLSGAGNLDCVVSGQDVDVLISHSQPEVLQLQVDIQDDGTELFGAVHITSGSDMYSSFVPPDGTGLAIDGSQVTYDGAFTTPTGEEVPGSVSVNCG
jgi:hypothetical protein